MIPIGQVLINKLRMSPVKFEDASVGGANFAKTGASIPNFTKLMANGGSTGIFLTSFGPGPQQHDAWGGIQLPHSRASFSDLDVHFHYFPTTNNVGDAIMEVEYAVANINDAFPVAATTLVTPITLSVAAPDVNVHKILTLFTITGSNIGMSAVIVFRLSRLGNAGGDTYTGDIAGLSFDAHVRIDSIGSDEPFVKYAP